MTPSLSITPVTMQGTGPAVDQVFPVLQGVNVLARAGGDRRHLRGVLTGAVRTALRPTVPLT